MNGNGWPNGRTSVKPRGLSGVLISHAAASLLDDQRHEARLPNGRPARPNNARGGVTRHALKVCE